MKKKQSSREVEYDVAEWPGLGDDEYAGFDACPRCGDLFMEGDLYSVFFTGSGEIQQALREADLLSIDRPGLCRECTIFFRKSLKSLGFKPRGYGEERLKRRLRDR